ncbi:hypothetical protein SVAN01_05665 [Stagonosporopsis vannaccii]|nr:hypothetical protein SVAN01_05665 [Stagonosporopsis vannaccii]
MRYDNWDIILFPEDSSIPIPEYKTACYFSRDEDGHELPTLRTYIGSLKPGTPFRISVHHWGPPRPSPILQQAQRRAGSDITFTVQVIIDGARLYYGRFAVNTSTPQEIVHEQISFRSQSIEQPTSESKHRLLFPRNDKNTLLRSSSWQPRGTDNRIKIILSEQLIDEEGSLDLDCWDIVCFSFQHAPRELLEQAGIAYPIVDPLRSLMGQRAPIAPQLGSRNMAAHELQRGSRIHSGHLMESDFERTRPVNLASHQQPSTRMPSIGVYPPQFTSHKRGGLPGSWQDSYSPFFDDDISMGSWPLQRCASNMIGVEAVHNSSHSPYAAQPWSHGTAAPGSRIGLNVENTRGQKNNDSHLLTMALRDDQLGQILEAISPSKKQRSKANGIPARLQRTHQTSTQTHRPPKIGVLSVPVRPASAAVARSAPYSDANTGSRDNIKTPLSGQAYPSEKTLFKTDSQHIRNKENQGSAISMQNPFVREPLRWDSDVSMGDGSPNISSLSKFERDPASLRSKIGSAHAPSASGAIKSRKEGLSTDARDALDADIRHDHSLLSTLDINPISRNTDSARGPPRNRLSRTDPSIEVVDLDVIDPNLVTETTANLTKLSPFKPAHKAGMSSISSTGRLERQLYSALGEELGSFEQQMNTANTGPELAQALSDMSTHRPESNASESEPVTKRKRQGALGDERDPNPMKKKEKAGQARVEDAEIPEDMPRLRGD